MRITSWNINSVRLRLPHLEKLVANYQPDIICLQETKVHDDQFPLEQIQNLGYENIYYSGSKSYNGVAIISKIKLKNIQKLQFANKDEPRHISAELPCGTEIHNLYVPAGGDEPDIAINPKFAHKLQFCDDITNYFSKQKGKKLIILGDLNIAPHPNDVWSHRQLLNVVSHTPIEVEKLENLQASLSFIDTHRKYTDYDQKLYSWWSYRSKDWRTNDRGRRLDHIWVTPNLNEQLTNAFIAKDVRSWEQPSDHVPIFIDISVI
jgi:exodeoxyribonuclease-3